MPGFMTSFSADHLDHRAVTDAMNAHALEPGSFLRERFPSVAGLDLGNDLGGDTVGRHGHQEVVLNAVFRRLGINGPHQPGLGVAARVDLAGHSYDEIRRLDILLSQLDLEYLGDDARPIFLFLSRTEGTQ